MVHVDVGRWGILFVVGRGGGGGLLLFMAASAFENCMCEMFFLLGERGERKI